MERDRERVAILLNNVWHGELVDFGTTSLTSIIDDIDEEVICEIYKFADDT